MKIILTRLKAGKLKSATPLRTDVVESNISKLPKVREQLYLWAAPLTEGAFARFVHTSPIVRIKRNKNNHHTIYTETGSKYDIEVLNENTVN